MQSVAIDTEAHLVLVVPLKLEPTRQIKEQSRHKDDNGLLDAVVDSARDGEVGGHVQAPVHGHGHGHVNGSRHKGVGGRKEEGDEQGKDVGRVVTAPVTKGKEEEGTDEKEDVVESQGAQDHDKVSPHLDVTMMQDTDGHGVAGQAKEADQRHQDGLDHLLKGHCLWRTSVVESLSAPVIM